MRNWGLIIVFAGCLLAAPSDLDRARQLYDRTEYDGALKLLLSLTSGASVGGPIWELIGKSYFNRADFKKAGEAFEKAIAADPNKSAYYHWLGRAYGRRAETSGPFTAPAYAVKARQNFEKAVALDARNIEAINDLFEYYLEAPGFLGGGMDKAAALSAKIRAVDPVEYHYSLAQIAERRKEYGTAEEHFRRAVEMAPRQVGRVIDLARFLSKQGRDQESEQLFAQAEKIAPDAPKLLFERARSYIRARKNLDSAKTLLERYLKAPLSPDDPPRADAERLLKQVAAGA
ncbi:MAG TPA: tetratricopeptide repeat protein [Bryobacteraceae bacterium]|nr:tetratricopeptide repeat protein [Bryobacteraceae bacterium]